MTILKRWWFAVPLLVLLVLGLRLYMLLDATPAYASLATNLFSVPGATPPPVQPTATPAKPASYEGPVNCHSNPVLPDTSRAKQPYADYINNTVAPKFGEEAAVLLWQVNQESGFNPSAISGAGAIGIAQFMPKTAAAYGIDPHDPWQSLMAMGQYNHNSLKSFWDWSGNIADQFGGNRNAYAWGLALAAYNAGGGAVGAALGWAGKNGWKDGPWMWLEAPYGATGWDQGQTSNYVANILGCLATR